MGTRSTVMFYQSNTNKPLINIYFQYDGYLEGKGIELAEWLMNKKIINGYFKQTDKEGYANGIECLSAQYIRDHKVGIGGMYITDIADRQEYNYSVRDIKGELFIEYEGINYTPEQFIDFINIIS